jgi:hypothetical protein
MQPLGCFAALAMTGWELVRLFQGVALGDASHSRRCVIPGREPGIPRDSRSHGGNTSADFSFASSDFKALGAFFCNFPIHDLR